MQRPQLLTFVLILAVTGLSIQAVVANNSNQTKTPQSTKHTQVKQTPHVKVQVNSKVAPKETKKSKAKVVLKHDKKKADALLKAEGANLHKVLISRGKDHAKKVFMRKEISAYKQVLKKVNKNLKASVKSKNQTATNANLKKITALKNTLKVHTKKFHVLKDNIRNERGIESDAIKTIENITGKPVNIAGNTTTNPEDLIKTRASPRMNKLMKAQLSLIEAKKLLKQVAQHKGKGINALTKNLEMKVNKMKQLVITRKANVKKTLKRVAHFMNKKLNWETMKDQAYRKMHRATPKIVSKADQKVQLLNEGKMLQDRKTIMGVLTSLNMSKLQVSNLRAQVHHALNDLESATTKMNQSDMTKKKIVIKKLDTKLEKAKQQKHVLNKTVKKAKKDVKTLNKANNKITGLKVSVPSLTLKKNIQTRSINAKTKLVAHEKSLARIQTKIERTHNLILKKFLVKREALVKKHIAKSSAKNAKVLKKLENDPKTKATKLAKKVNKKTKKLPLALALKPVTTSQNKNIKQVSKAKFNRKQQKIVKASMKAKNSSLKATIKVKPSDKKD